MSELLKARREWSRTHCDERVLGWLRLGDILSCCAPVVMLRFRGASFLHGDLADFKAWINVRGTDLGVVAIAV